MRIHLFIVFITHKFRTSKKLVEIRGGGGGGASLGLEIQAGGGVQLTRKSGREMGKKKNLAICRRGVDFFWNYQLYAGCMKSGDTGMPILYIEFRIQFFFTVVATCSP